MAIDTIFAVEEHLRENFPDDRKFSYTQKGQLTEKNYSAEYSLEFDRLTNNMVERKLRTAIAAVGSFWYTAWVNAGQPNLDNLKESGALKKDSIQEFEKPEAIEEHE